MKNKIVLALIALAPLAEPAFASSSAWHETEGGRVRLVTSGAPDEEKTIRGALQIELKPGWKTYWIDPGDAGVPPTLSNPDQTSLPEWHAEMKFPAPSRFDDGFAKWAGYDHPVSFPVLFHLQPHENPVIEADVFLGVCETICIPVQAKLGVDLASDPGNEEDAAVVQAAFEALPTEARPDFGVKAIPGDKDAVTVEATFSGDPAAVDFFLAGSDGYQFGPPERRQDGGRLLFVVPILQRPDKAPDNGALNYVLVDAAGAVAGTIALPLAQ